MIKSRIGARILRVATLAAGIGLGIATQHWSLMPSIVAHFHWELPRPRQLSVVAGAEFFLQLQAACAFFISEHFHWETARQIVSVVVNTYAH